MKLTQIILMAILPIMCAPTLAEITSPSQEAVHSTEAPSVSREDTFKGDPIPTVPPQITGSHSPAEELSEGIPDEVKEDSEGKVKWYGKVWDYLAAGANVQLERGRVWNKRRAIRGKYVINDDDEVSVDVMLAIEQAMRIAEEVREQRALALAVKLSEEKRLHDDSTYCLQLNGFREARSQTADQEVATAAVVMNRLSVGFRDATTICGVVQTPEQFSWVAEYGMDLPDLSNKKERKAWERSGMIAKRMMAHDAGYIDPSNGAVYYYNPDVVDWEYKEAYVQVAILGNHRFMTEQKGHKYFIDNQDIRINPVLFNGLSHDQRDALKAEFQLKKED